MKTSSHRLGDAISIKHGYAFSGDYITQVDNGIVLVTPGNFRVGGGFQEEKCKYYKGELPEAYVLKPGDLIVTMTDLSKKTDTLGFSALVPENNRTYLHNQRIGLVKVVSDDFDKNYLHWLMRTYEYQRAIANTATGASVKHTSPTKIYDFEFKAPSKPLQTKIAQVLNAYEDLIENNKKQIKLLEEAAMRLYKEWFIDLRFPGHETTEVLDGVPEGWSHKEVGAMISKVPRTKQVKKSEYKTKGSIPIIDQSREFVSGYTDDVETVVDLGIPVIVFGDHTRVLKLIKFPFAKGADGTQLMISNDEKMSQHLFYCSLLNIDLSNYHYARHYKYLKSTTIIVPTSDVSDEFERISQPVFTAIQRMKDKILLLQQARDSLLPKLMNGEIEV